MIQVGETIGMSWRPLFKLRLARRFLEIFTLFPVILFNSDNLNLETLGPFIVLEDYWSVTWSDFYSNVRFLFEPLLQLCSTFLSVPCHCFEHFNLKFPLSSECTIGDPIDRHLNLCQIDESMTNNEPNRSQGYSLFPWGVSDSRHIVFKIAV